MEDKRVLSALQHNAFRRAIIDGIADVEIAVCAAVRKQSIEPEIHLRMTRPRKPVEQPFFRKRNLVEKRLPRNENRLAREIDDFALARFRQRLFRQRLQLEILEFNRPFEIASEHRERINAAVHG